MASESTWRVGFPIYQGSTLLDFAGATQVFAFTPGFEPVWLAPTLDPIETTERVRVLPGATFSDAGLRAQDQEFIDKIREATIVVIGGGCRTSYRPSAYPKSPMPIAP